MGEEIKVERLLPQDAPEIEELLKKVWPWALEYPEAWRRKRTLPREKILEEMEKGIYYFGVRKEGKLVGMYKAVPLGEEVLGEHQTVDPEWRGKGLAIAMYRHLLEFAREKGFKKVVVNILPDQLPSKKCVDQLGFRKRGGLWEQEKGMWVQTYEKEVEG
ncbi:MAG: GNAT family N-acetyltransferase [Candidatus Hadarchaeales archaeon]